MSLTNYATYRLRVTASLMVACFFYSTTLCGLTPVIKVDQCDLVDLELCNSRVSQPQTAPTAKLSQIFRTLSRMRFININY